MQKHATSPANMLGMGKNGEEKLTADINVTGLVGGKIVGSGKKHVQQHKEPSQSSEGILNKNEDSFVE